MPPVIPFGGCGQSGYERSGDGRKKGFEALHHCTQLESITFEL